MESAPKGLLPSTDQDEAGRKYEDLAYDDMRIRDLPMKGSLTLPQGAIVDYDGAFYELEVDTVVTVSSKGPYSSVGVKLPTGEQVYVATGTIFGPQGGGEALDQAAVIGRVLGAVRGEVKDL